MGEIIDIDSFRPHATSTVTCKSCEYTWQAVYPVGTDYLECPSCSSMVNEYGTPVAARVCTSCGAKFTICPAPENLESGAWDGCMAPECDSYDQGRDADKLFEAGLIRQDEDE